MSELYFMEVQGSEMKGYIYTRLCELLCKLNCDRSSYMDKNVPTTFFLPFSSLFSITVQSPFF